MMLLFILKSYVQIVAMFRRNKHIGQGHTEHQDPHDHIHDATELIATTRTVTGRTKTLIAGIANAFFMGCGLYAGSKTGAHPSLAEAVHDFSDVSFYMTPWFASINQHIESQRTLRWMRASSAVSALVASSAILYEAHAIFTDQYATPQLSSIPLQAAFAYGNYRVARYMGDGDHKANAQSLDAVSGSSLRHAQYDAGTSAFLTGGNLAAQFVPVVGPASALIANVATLTGEVRNQKHINSALTTTTL